MSNSSACIVNDAVHNTCGNLPSVLARSGNDISNDKIISDTVVDSDVNVNLLDKLAMVTVTQTNKAPVQQLGTRQINDMTIHDNGKITTSVNATANYTDNNGNNNTSSNVVNVYENIINKH